MCVTLFLCRKAAGDIVNFDSLKIRSIYSYFDLNIIANSIAIVIVDAKLWD